MTEQLVGRSEGRLVAEADLCRPLTTPSVTQLLPGFVLRDCRNIFLARELEAFVNGCLPVAAARLSLEGTR